MAGWILTLMIFMPALGALALWGLAAWLRIAPQVPALVASLVTLALTVAAVVSFRNPPAEAGVAFSYEARADWLGTAVDGLETSYHVGVDGISLWLVALTALLAPLVILASFSSIRERTVEYYALMLLLQSAVTGVFCALDLLLFFVFFEFTLIPLYLLIGIWGGPDRRHAANKFFIYTMAGSVLTFAGILYIAYHGYVQSQAAGPALWSFDVVQLYAGAGQPGWLSAAAQWWVFIALFAGFAIKVPLFPFHTWLPLAHTEAPTGGSVLLAGVLLKLGTYGFLRLTLPLLPDASFALGPWMAALAIAGIIYGALIAWVQTDVKKLVAYSSVSHLGFCMLGMFTLKMAGLSGAVLYMINHGLSTGALFLIVGMVYERYHTRDIHRIGGLARQMPQLAFFLVFFTFTSIGLPGLNGFVSEFLVLLGTAISGTATDGLRSGPLGVGYAIPAATGIILGAVYMLWMCQRLLFGPLKEPPGTPDLSVGLSPDLGQRERWVLIPLAVCCLVLGVYPRAVQSSIDPAIRRHSAMHYQVENDVADLGMRTRAEDG